MGDQTAVGKGADMSEEMHQRAVERAVLAIEKYNVEREVAALIKRVNVCLQYPAVERYPHQKPSRATMSDRKAATEDTDASEEAQQDAVEGAIPSLEECSVEHDTAAHIRRISVCS